MKTWLQVCNQGYIIRLMHKHEQLPGKPYPYLYWQIVFRSITINTLEKISHWNLADHVSLVVLRAHCLNLSLLINITLRVDHIMSLANGAMFVLLAETVHCFVLLVFPTKLCIDLPCLFLLIHPRSLPRCLPWVILVLLQWNLCLKPYSPSWLTGRNKPSYLPNY